MSETLPQFDFWFDFQFPPFRAAWIDKCRPDLLITESTYATTIRDSKRCRERDFLKKVHETVERGGKVQWPLPQIRCSQIEISNSPGGNRNSLSAGRAVPVPFIPNGTKHSWELKE